MIYCQYCLKWIGPNNRKCPSCERILRRKAIVAKNRNIASESTRKHVLKTIIDGDGCVVCPNCERTDILSGGWPGTECSEGWRCKCECGQKMLVVGHLKSQREAAGTADGKPDGQAENS